MKTTFYKLRLAAMLAIDTIPNKQNQRAVKSYIEHLEMTMNEAFNNLAADNTYSPAVNKTWELLGTSLGKMHSTDHPYFESEK